MIYLLFYRNWCEVRYNERAAFFGRLARMRWEAYTVLSDFQPVLARFLSHFAASHRVTNPSAKHNFDRLFHSPLGPRPLPQEPQELWLLLMTNDGKRLCNYYILLYWRSDNLQTRIWRLANEGEQRIKNMHYTG